MMIISIILYLMVGIALGVISYGYEFFKENLIDDQFMCFAIMPILYPIVIFFEGLLLLGKKLRNHNNIKKKIKLFNNHIDEYLLTNKIQKNDRLISELLRRLLKDDLGYYVSKYDIFVKLNEYVMLIKLEQMRYQIQDIIKDDK